LGSVIKMFAVSVRLFYYNEIRCVSHVITRFTHMYIELRRFILFLVYCVSFNVLSVHKSS